VNRELTVNLRLTAANSENAKAASDTVAMVNQVRDAMTAASRAAEGVGKSVAQMGANTKTSASTLDSLKSKLSETANAATTAATAVSKVTEAVKNVNGVVLSGATAWTSASRQILTGVAAWTSAKDTIEKTTYAVERLTTAARSLPADKMAGAAGWMSSAATGPRGVTAYSAPIGPTPFDQLSGPELMDFVRRQRPGSQQYSMPIGPQPTSQPRREFLSREWESNFDERFDQQVGRLTELESSFDQAATARRRLASADREYLEGVQRMIGGVTSLARSFVLLTAANDEDAAAMLKTIARFESVAQAINGVIGVVQGATKAWQQYAIAAELAGGVATLGGFTARTGGMGIAIAGAAVGSAAIASAGALAVEGISDYFSGDTVSTSGDYLAGFGANFWEYMPRMPFGYSKPFNQLAQSNYKTERMVEGRSRSSNALLQRQRFLVNQYQTGEAYFQSDFTDSQLRAGVGLEGGQRGMSVARAGLSSVMSRRFTLSTGKETDDLQVQAETRRESRQLLEQERTLTVQLHESRIQAAQEEIQTARERLSIAQRESEINRQRLNQTRSGMAGMDAGEQRELIRAVRAAEGGEYVNARGRAAIRGAGLRGFDDAIMRSEEQDIAKNPELLKIFQQQQGLNSKAEIDVKVNSELVVKLEQDFEKQKPIWEAELMKFLENQFVKIQEAIKKEREADMRAAAEQARLQQQARDK
jgi:hypothetical protein